MKPKIFIASSVENLDIAYAAQEALEHDVEATVWSQGVFTPSRTAMASLIDVLDDSDFGLFIFSPDDIVNFRDCSLNAVRDNVVFELGLFIGRLGSDRCFMVVPRGVEDLHFPTDLLGLTPATYDPDRQDGNMVASLGPACNRIRKAIARIGLLKTQTLQAMNAISEPAFAPISDQNDCILLIQSWMGARTEDDNCRAIRYTDVDRELKLLPGSAEKYIQKAAENWDYKLERKGKDFILFAKNYIYF
ncbi:TIR domain-containing protein [Azospirillum rugosum]|uniref:CD-NTase-associated protein 12/Pycsar effector protein TIR domain-containing protein n=1 Tax=Azospirillum rugosum TaxID=416170 RepID=A0ABS4SQS2_9PROT|nr:nucleotide-binding protein [Azospirillum rugosum]MBP2294918.1 hypothetical protein [Azospirillum rugosum]MDQ0528160.1 hypothetical protein [Azospirillum rugosum]